MNNELFENKVKIHDKKTNDLIGKEKNGATSASSEIMNKSENSEDSNDSDDSDKNNTKNQYQNEQELQM